MKNKNTKKVENFGNAKVNTQRPASILRRVGIGILFVLLVLSAVFAFGSFNEWREQLAKEAEYKAYAANNANDENYEAWVAAIDASGSINDPQECVLQGNWIADVVDEGNSKKNRTMFGSDNNYHFVRVTTTTYNYSGALFVPAKKHVVLDLNGYTIDRNLINGLGEPMQQHGYVISIAGKLTIKDSRGGGKITGGWNAYSLASYNSSSVQGGGINVYNGGILELESGSITGNRAASGGAGVHNSGSEFYMSGGSITGNVLDGVAKSYWAASGLYMWSAHTEMSGGTISNNTSDLGDYNRGYQNTVGGVFLCQSSKYACDFIMTGGSITGNESWADAWSIGGIYATSSGYNSVCLYGGSVTNNKAYAVGGIDKMGAYNLVMHGSPVVKDNYAIDSDDDDNELPIAWDVDLYGGRGWYDSNYRHYAIDIDGAMESGAHVNVVKFPDNYLDDTNNSITNGYGAANAGKDPTQFFFPSLPQYSIAKTVMIFGGGTLECGFENKLDIINWMDANSHSSADNPLTVKLHGNVEADENGYFSWPWQLCSWAFPYYKYTDGYMCNWVNNSANNYLDYPERRFFKVNKGAVITLDLNGYTIDRKLTGPKEYGYLFDISAGSSLEITDTRGGGKITGGWDVGASGGISVGGTGSSFTLSGGSIEGNKGTAGPAMDIGAGATVKIKGGSIKNNLAYRDENGWYGIGGAIYFNDGQKEAMNFTMTGGEISGNHAEDCGGAIYAGASSYDYGRNINITITGGSIINNTCGSDIWGGGICIDGQTIFFGLGGNPVISGNKANGKANDIWLQSTDMSKTDGQDNALISVVSPFTGSNKYGVYRDINYTFTENFKRNNPTADPATRFFSQKKDVYVGKDKNGEAQFLSDHGYDNWYSAVVMSHAMGGRQYTVKLTENWTAVPNATSDFGTSFYGDETVDTNTDWSYPYYYGSICVPDDTDIVLDLNGFTIDRGLSSSPVGYYYGNVITVDGATFTLKDTSAAKTGKITGGWAHNGDAYYHGGGITIAHPTQSRVFIEGGKITGNRSTVFGVDKNNVSHPLGVGGIGFHNDTKGNVGQLTIRGGEITNNFGTYAGGIAMGVLTSGTLSLGGNAVIYGNTALKDGKNLGDGKPCDLLNYSDTAGSTVDDMLDTDNYKFNIIAPFTAGAKIGISRPDTNNYDLIDTEGNVFTYGYSMYNSGKNPNTVFYPSDPDMAEIRTYTNFMTRATEATFYIKDAAINWSNAVAAKVGVNDVPLHVTLYKDWIADENGSFRPSADFTEGFTDEGGLYMPYSNIILDLNGYTIDRGFAGLSEGKNDGTVIWMEKNCGLEIIDSKGSGRTGVITGGFSKNDEEAGGIHMNSATCYFSLNGGTVTGNKGGLGGIATYSSGGGMEGNYFGMGNDALVTGNYDLYDRDLNINLRANFVQSITLEYTLTNPGKSGVTKDGSGDFTEHFKTFHESITSRNKPSQYFVADSPLRFVIDTAGGEGALYTYDNYTNWSFAVRESMAHGDTRTVTLVSDWIADGQGLLAPDDTDTETMVSGGALYTNSAKIILDLAGYTINRNLSNPTWDGYVIYVESNGQLTLRDSSERQTGTITGGNNYYTTATNNQAGGGVVNRGRFFMEGGKITGNYASGHADSVGGVVNITGKNIPGLFRMTGGEISGNFGTFTGGVNLYNGSQVYIGGTSKIINNMTLGGEPADVRANGDDISSKINIHTSFKPGAEIGVYYVCNNYMSSYADNVFTAGFGAENATLSPADIFHASSPDKYKVVSYLASSGIEGRIECIDNEQNWREAVAASLKYKNQQYVKLNSDWNAFPIGTTTMFGNDPNAYSNGALQVPTTGSGKTLAVANIVLDLNGYTLNRGLTTRKAYGYVINVRGILEIQDNSTSKRGTITGGYSNNTAGGIDYSSGQLWLSGGTITGNKGTVGGVYIHGADDCEMPFGMGGSALVTGNTDNFNKDSDIVVTNPVQMIEIYEPLTEKARGKTGFTRNGVGDFTVGFAELMPTEDPTDFFKSADPMYVFKYDNGEAALYTNSNQLNWQYAVEASLAGGGKTIIFKLLENWKAELGEFGPNVTGYYHGDDNADFQGMLFVPTGAAIILDLNGYTIDRGIKAAASLGCVIVVDGSLDITDDSETGGGIITGGYNGYSGGNTAAQSSAIWLNKGYLGIWGGTITGNRATGHYSSAITVGNKNTHLYIGGNAVITGNYGGPFDDNTGAGAISVHYNQSLHLCETPKIEGNFHNFGGYSCDVHLEASGLYIDVFEAFKRGASIGVAPASQVNNYASGEDGVQFTTGFSSFHTEGDNPERYFFGSWYQAHEIRHTMTSTGVEGTFWCMENYTNWINAVKASIPNKSTSKVILFELTSDWIATENSGEANEEYTTSFHPYDRSYYRNGAIYLPARAQIILDLKGFKIDRNLLDKSAIYNGYTMYIDGSLEIIDTSRLKTGKITGANNIDGGGAIIVDTGSLSIKAGSITDNKGTLGAGVYVMDKGYVEIGGYVEIYGNTNAAGEPSNLYLNNPGATLPIVSDLKTRNIIGVNRPANGTVTEDFQKWMPGNNPLDYFVSENANYYGIEGGDGELFFLSPDNFTNWQYAVAQSIATGKWQTVRLTGDWVADDDFSFGGGTGFLNGALYVPANAKIELDLAGHTINRNIGSAMRYGSVFNILGKFRITDSSEEGTGLITGGRIDRAEVVNKIYWRAGGIQIGANASVEMLGGTIAGNWSTAEGTPSAGGVYVSNGATFLLKDAAVKNNQSTEAGIYVENGGTLNVGGKAIVENNKSGAGIHNDVVTQGYTTTMGVTSALTSGAHIGVSRWVNNYAGNSYGGSEITSDYSRYNSQPASTFFFSSDPSHVVIDKTNGSITEAALFCQDNYSNWVNAVNLSISSKREVEVKMYGDWTAGRDNQNTSFGGNKNAFINGALYVPATAQIVLDLNNNVINRDLPRANSTGYVMYVAGSLHIIDTSSAGAGLITGGWTEGTSIDDTSIAAGIHVLNKAALTLEGGSVSGNKGVGIYLAGNNSFALGGKTKVTANAFDGEKNETNIYLNNESQMIDVISEFGPNSKFGVIRSRGASNFASGTLTNNYSKFNRTVEPTTYFTSDDTRYMIVDEGFFDDQSMEAAFLGKDNLTNWAHAVKTSLANGGRATVCTLYEDWTADDHKTFTKSFGNISNIACFYRGALYVPAKCHVILDLNGHTIDRALTYAINDGEVIYVRGTLVVKDSSAEQTGSIRGGFANGNSTSYHNGRAGGIAVYTGTLSIEGGTITGNYASSYAGGVYLSGGSTFSMLGGKITGNSGRGIGGVYVLDNATASFGGNAYVYGNKWADTSGSTIDDVDANVYITKATSNRVYITDTFKEGAKIGISVSQSHVPAYGRIITDGWGSYNNEFEATKVFSSDEPTNYALVDYNEDGTHEAMLLLRNNKLNWQYAVQTSLSQKDTQTFVLYEDWTATMSGATKSSFGSGTGYDSTGTIFVPRGASIILDLNGHTIDRGLYDLNVSVTNAWVIHVEGALTIIDSTAHMDKNGKIIQGKITGGNTDSNGGGIWACDGSLNIEAGHITKNKAKGIGAGIAINNKVTIGGTVQFSDNYIIGNGRREDIGFYDNKYVIGIGSQLAIDADEAKNEIYVKRSKIGEFTSDWGKYNPTVKPETRFISALGGYRVSSTGSGSNREAVMLSNNNNDNWVFAVQSSMAYEAPQYFALVENWTATNYAGKTYSTSFGTNSTAYRNGALLVPAGADIVLDLAGCTLDRAQALANGSKYPAQNVTIIVEGKLQIIDSSVTKAGTIKGGSYGVYVNKNTASVTFGGLIQPEGLVLLGDETNMYGKYFGGTITDNTYGVYVESGSFTATGGKATANKLADVCASKNTSATINVGDDAYIYTPGRTSGVSLRLENGLGLINIVSKLSDDAKIGFSRQSVGQLTNGWGLKNGNDTNPDASIFVSEEPAIYNCKTELINGYKELTVSSFDNAVNWQAAVDKSLATSGEWQEFNLYTCWTAAADDTYKTSFGSGTAYVSGALYVPEGARIKLNLNGHKLNRNLKEAVQNGLVIQVDGELEIMNELKDNPSGLVYTCCTRNSGLITGGYNSTGSSGGALNIGENGRVVLSGGTITGNKATSQSASAGAIYTAGMLLMDGGTIFSNSGTYAGGVYVANSGNAALLYGGVIEENNATNGGGAVYTTGNLVIDGGVLRKNTGIIGGVYVARGSAVLETGSITENNGSSAGGVFVNNATNTYFKMNSGAISGNKATNAGGIYTAGVVEITGGVIKENTATGTTLNDGGGAIYIAGTANVTITHGTITENNGENGIRVHSSGILNVGGGAWIFKNNATNKTNASGEQEVEANDYCDIYFTAKTRKLNVVSEFIPGAKIGIYRLGAGVFTTGYGMYNDAHPNTVFVSNRSVYSVSKTANDDVTKIEASIGIPVDPEPDVLATPNVYNGNWQTLIKDIDETQVTIGVIDPQTMRLGTADGKTTIEVVNAGEYTIGFTLKDGYCWKDGTTDQKIIHATLEAKVVNLVWSKEVHKDGEDNDIVDAMSGQPVCVYDGVTVHAPVVVVKDDELETNVLTGEKDTCTVTFSGSTIYASDEEGHTAKATSLSNSNYKLGTTGLDYKFVVEKAERPDFKVTSTQTFYRTPTQMEVEGNLENGKLHFYVEDGYTSIATIDESTGELLVSQIGARVKIRVVADETDNYKQSTTVSEEIECVVGQLKATIAPAEVTYGDSVSLTLAGTHNPDEIGNVTFAIVPDVESTGSASLNTFTGEFVAQGVGTVRVVASVEGNSYYLETTIEGTITIVPRTVTLDWGTSLKVPYNGDYQTLGAPEYSGVLPADLANFNIEVVQAGFKGWDTAKKSATWMDVGKYEVGVILSNPNYALANEEDYFPEFEITKAKPDLKFTASVAYLNIPFKPEVKGAMEGAKVDISLSGTNLGRNYTYNSATGEYTPKALGWMMFTVTVAETKNYEAVTISGSYTIVKAEMPLEVNPNEIHYGDNATEITISYKDTSGNRVNVTNNVAITLKPVYNEFADLTFVDGKPYITPKKAGTIAVTVNAPGTDLYVPTEADLEIVIKPREVTVTWTYDTEYVYDGTIQTPTATILSGVLPADTVEISGYEAYQENEEGELVKVDAKRAGDYVVKAILDNPNYVMAEESNGEFTIKPLPVDLVWSDLVFVYNGEDQAPTANIRNGVRGDDCSVEVLGARPAGTSLTAQATGLKGADKDNYTLEGGDNLSWNFTINPKPVTVTWGDTELQYTGQQQAPEAIIDGVIEGDDCSVVVGGKEINVNPAGVKYTAIASSLTGAQSGNYTLDGYTFPQEFTILPIDPEITLKQTEIVYGDQFVLELEGNTGGGTITFTLGAGAENATLGAGNLFTAQNVGTVEIIIDVTASQNYNEAHIETEITINPRPIKVTWNDLTFTYDKEEHNPTATVSNTVNGDNVEITLSNPQINAGTHTASVNKVITIDGVKTNLYTIEGGTDVEKDFEILKRLATIVWSDTEFTYDGEEHAPTATLGNLLDGDTCTATVSGQKNAGMNIQAHITELSNDNYTVEGAPNETGRYNILQRLAKLSWTNTTLPYTGNEQLPTVTITNLVEGDECNVSLSGAASAVGTHTAEATGLTGADSANYTLYFDPDEPDEDKRTQIECEFTIEKGSPEVTLGGLEVVFGSTLTLSWPANPTGEAETYTIVSGGTGSASISDNVLTPTQAGTVNVHLHVEESANYKEINKDFEVTIKKLPVVITWTYGTYTYNKTEQKPTPTITNEVSGYPCSVVTVTGSVNAGENLKAEVTAISDSVNYTLEDGTAVETKFAIQPLIIDSITWDENRTYPFSGEPQGPNATANGIITGDDCKVLVDGWRTNKGNWTAKITGLENPNYSMEGIENLTADFEITKSTPTLRIITNQVVIGETVEIEVEGNIGNGNLTFEIIDGEDYGELVNGDNLRGKLLGTVKIKVTVDETPNTDGTYVEGEIRVTKGYAPLKLADDKVMYGSTLTLEVDDDNGRLRLEDDSLMFGNVTFSVEPRFADIAEIRNGNILVTKDVGEIKVRMTTQDNEYFEATTVFATVTITQRVVTLEWVDGTYTYNAKQQAPQVNISNRVNNDECVAEVQGAKNAGGWTAQVTGLTGRDSGKYTLERATNMEKDFTINPYELTMTWGDLSIEYNGQDQTPEAIVEPLEDDECEVNLVVVGPHTIVGTYTVTTDGVSNPNYVLDREYQTTYNIVKATLKPEFNPNEVVYGTTELIGIIGNIDNAPYTLTIDSNNSVGLGTLTRKPSGDYEFTATRVGNVKIKVHVDGTANCNAYDGTIDLEVIKADRNIELVTAEGVYGEDLVLQLTGNDDDPGMVIFTVADNLLASITGNTLTPKHAGNVTITIVIGATSNYNSTSITVQVTIRPRVINVTWENSEFTYNGKEQTPEAKISNLLPGDECEIVVKGGQINADTYTTAYVESVSNPDYTVVGSQSAFGHLFTIGKASIDLDLETDHVYMGEETELKVKGNSGNAPVTFVIDDERTTGKATLKDGNILVPVQKGSVMVTASVDESENYLGGTKTRLVVIDKSRLNLTMKNTTVQYGTDLDLDIEGNIERQEITFTVTNADGEAKIISGSTLRPIKAGKVIVKVHIAATENYAATDTEFEITITPIEVELMWSNFEFTYDGVNIYAPTARIRSGLLDGDECEVKVYGGQIDADTYAEGTAYADDSSLSNPNYYLGGKVVKAPQFVINRANLVITFATTEVPINEPTEIKLNGNKGNGTATFALGVVTDTAHLSNLGEATLEGNMITGTKLGYVHVLVAVATSQNYNNAFAECDILVEKPAAKVDFENKVVTYGDTLELVVTNEDPESGFSYTLEADTTGDGSYTLSGNTLTATGAGEVYVYINTTETESYKATHKKITITINPIVVEVSWSTEEFEYDGEEHAPTPTITNSIGTDTFNITVKGEKYANDQATAEITDLGNPNYTIEGSETATKTFKIKPRKVELTWTYPELTYDGTMQVPVATVDNVVTGDSVSVNVQGETNAGEDLIAKAYGLTNSNYTLYEDDGELISNAQTTYTIKPYAVFIEWGELTLVYTGYVNVPTAKAIGTLNGDVVNATVEGVGADSGSCIHASDTPYQAKAIGLDNSNYTLKAPEAEAVRYSVRRMAGGGAPLTTDYTINPVEVTLNEVSLRQEYNGEEQDPDIQLMLLNPSDDLTLEYINGKQTNVGKYDVTLTLTGSSFNDYVLADADVHKEFTITPKKIEVKVTTKDTTAEYTGEAVKLTDWYDLSATGFVGDDEGKSVAEIFPTNTLEIAPIFEQDGTQLTSAGSRGEYKLLADLDNVTGTLGGNTNYVAKLVLDTSSQGKLTISGGAALQLADDSTYKFIYAEVEESYGFVYTYRKSYDEKGWVHGKDDLDFDRVVLGNILPKTCVGDLLANLSVSQLDSIRIYNYDDELVYDCGQPGEDFTEDDFYDKDSLVVGTGWRILYGKNESMADVVYISVLGDIDGSGDIDMNDSTMLVSYVNGSDPSVLQDLEFFLAALITNSGYPSASDIGEIGAIFMRWYGPDEYFL